MRWCTSSFKKMFIILHDFPYLQIRNVVEHYVKLAAIFEIII